jgi:hypothetical protein
MDCYLHQLVAVDVVAALMRMDYFQVAVDVVSHPVLVHLMLVKLVAALEQQAQLRFRLQRCAHSRAPYHWQGVLRFVVQSLVKFPQALQSEQCQAVQCFRSPPSSLELSLRQPSSPLPSSLVLPLLPAAHRDRARLIYELPVLQQLMMRNERIRPFLGVLQELPCSPYRVA